MSARRTFSRALGATGERDATFALLVTAVFLAGLSIVHGFHEFWRDELHCWSIGRSADGLLDLLTGERRYDGHPFLWYYVLHLVSRVFRGPFGLHAITVLLASGSCFLWVRYSGFPRFLRLMFLPTQLFFFEYGVMSRSYTLGIFLAFVFAATYRRLRLAFVMPSIVLVLVAATSVYGAMWSCALAVLLFTHGWKGTSPPIFTRGVRVPASLLAGAGIWLAGMVLVVMTTMPPQDAMYDSPWHVSVSLSLVHTIGNRLWGALFPYQLTGWPAYGWLGMTIPALASWLPRLAVGLFVCWMLSFVRSWRVTLTFVLGMTMMALFQEWKYLGGARHTGHFMLFIVVCAWLFRRETRGRYTMWVSDTLLAIVFAVQIVTAARVIHVEVKTPFSGAYDAARFIRTHGWQDAVLIGNPDYAAMGVAGYLDRPFVSAENGEVGPYELSHNRRINASPADALALVPHHLEASGKNEAVLVFNADPGPALQLPGYKAEVAFVSDQPLGEPDERLWIYHVTRGP